MALNRLQHPAFRTAIGTALGYGALLLVMTVVLFAIPYAIFAGL
ncbi:hypothetical protein [Halocatena halophila]